ncbi:hypothetical protein B7463_g5341, partial [Scytalidium lignicola]
MGKIMGEFQDAVTSLLETFTRGISIIKGRRKRNAAAQVAETSLSKSLKQSRSDVKDRYREDLSRHGKAFAAGDAQAYLSLNAILARLNAGFFAVLERFTRGQNTPADYESLISLSNASRIETIITFDQLSMRLSKSSLALPSPAKPEGWVRPKTPRKSSADSLPPTMTNPKPTVTTSTSISKTVRSKTVRPERNPSVPSKTRKRISFMSFASDSTKLGEIPQYKWARPPLLEGQEMQFPVVAYYPLEPYQQPKKQRTGIMKLFKRRQ